MTFTPDEIVYWQMGPVKLNATIVFSWLVMALIIFGSWLATRNLSTDPKKMSRWQNFIETVVSLIRDQIRDVTHQNPDRYLPFIGTLFLFISVSNFLSIVPGYEPPTGSLSAAAALALCVFVAVPFFGIQQQGVVGYLKNYVQPTVLMLPFQIISEVSRTLSLAIRLFGNVMSGTIIIAILLTIVPLFVPVVLEVLSLLIGQIQAYVFAILATVYIGSAARSQQEASEDRDKTRPESR